MFIFRAARRGRGFRDRVKVFFFLWVILFFFSGVYFTSGLVLFLYLEPYFSWLCCTRRSCTWNIVQQLLVFIIHSSCSVRVCVSLACYRVLSYSWCSSNNIQEAQGNGRSTDSVLVCRDDNAKKFCTKLPTGSSSRTRLYRQTNEWANTRVERSTERC